MTKVVNYTHHAPNVGSSAVKKVWYASPEREMYVQVPSGAIYGYRDVSPVAYDKFLSANSRGRFYNVHVKGVYSSTGDVEGLVEFRAAPGLSRKNTDTKNNWGSSSVFSPSVPSVAMPKNNKHYSVTGTVLRPTSVTESIGASSLEEAMKIFRDKYKDSEPEVTGVRQV